MGKIISLLKKLKPESIKYIVIALVLFLVLIIVLLTTRDIDNSERRRVDSDQPPIVRIIRSSDDQSLITTEDRNEVERFILTSPELDNQDILKALELDSDQTVDSLNIHIPSVLVGRQNTQETSDRYDYFEQLYIEHLKNPGYFD
jgi:hypothetical protein